MRLENLKKDVVIVTDQDRVLNELALFRLRLSPRDEDIITECPLKQLSMNGELQVPIA
jgi:hypothetical protein